MCLCRVIIQWALIWFLGLRAPGGGGLFGNGLWVAVGTHEVFGLHGRAGAPNVRIFTGKST